MILDSLQQFQSYLSLNPLFCKVSDFLQKNDLSQLALGLHKICGEDVYVNIVDSEPKSREEARLETHCEMIDIQIPISSTEEHGYSPRNILPPADYDKENDISFYNELPLSYVKVHPGEFVIYLPNDAHAPAITPVTLRKAIFKVKYIK